MIIGGTDMYKVTIVWHDGTKTVTDECDTYSLIRALEKCEIKSFKVELDYH